MPSVARRYHPQRSQHPKNYAELERKQALRMQQQSQGSDRVEEIKKQQAREKAEEASRAPVILMVSGGADSTALFLLALTKELDIEDARGCAKIARERLHVLHVNHGLREQSADEDEEFVRELAERYGVAYTIKKIDVAARARELHDNVENVGREARYAAANQLADELSSELRTARSAARILTAHTANDRAETFFMNAIKGAGSAGLSSIPRRRGRIVRPLLDKTHDELCEFLRMHELIWCEDDSNRDTTYTRAYVRHELIPRFESINPQVVSHVARSCDILADEDAYLASLAARARRELLRQHHDRAHVLDARRLAVLEVALARRVIIQELAELFPDGRFAARHIHQILSCVAKGMGVEYLPGDLVARVHHGLLFLRVPGANESFASGWVDVPALGTSVQPGAFPLGQGRYLTVRLLELPAGIDPEQAALRHAQQSSGLSVLLDAVCVGADAASGAHLWIGHAEPGDILCPFGMNGRSKKLSDLLQEHVKVREDRAHVPIVKNSPTGSILWVGGIRLDERVRCSQETRLALELSIVRP